jgi:hypothetical protein
VDEIYDQIYARMKQGEDVRPQEVQAIRMKLGPSIAQFMEACAEHLRKTTGWTRAMSFQEAVIATELARPDSSNPDAHEWQVLAQVRQIPYPYVPLSVMIKAEDYLQAEARWLMVAHIYLNIAHVNLPIKIGRTIRDYILAEANMPGEITIRRGDYPISTEKWSAR